jgi:hypothetical protein
VVTAKSAVIKQKSIEFFLKSIWSSLVSALQARQANGGGRKSTSSEDKRKRARTRKDKGEGGKKRPKLQAAEDHYEPVEMGMGMDMMDNRKPSPTFGAVAVKEAPPAKPVSVTSWGRDMRLGGVGRVIDGWIVHCTRPPRPSSISHRWWRVWRPSCRIRTAS